MSNELVLDFVMIKPSSIHGLGVFARQAISKNTVIEVSPILLLSENPLDLNDYLFNSTDGKLALALGYGSLYNHSNNPNAKFQVDAKNQRIVISANRNISKGEEIFIFYGDKWVSSREIKMSEISSTMKLWNFLVGIPLRGGLVFLGIILLIILLKIIL